MNTQLVWLKRDLRLNDHRPLLEASRRGPCIVLYVYEPELFLSPEWDASHTVFINQSLIELQQNIEALGGRITYRVGRMPEILNDLYASHPFSTMWSHEETGNYCTYMRDIRVKTWAQSHNIEWHEIPQHGIIRPLKTRDGWSARWNRRMNEPAAPDVESITPVSLDHGSIHDESMLQIPKSGKPDAQSGGESEAWETLESFLTQRGVRYRTDMSSPVTGWQGCSRLSPHLAWGTISMKSVYQRTKEQRDRIKADRDRYEKHWLPSLTSFMGRLRWHCHFMQKLEDEPELEFRNLNRAYDGLREDEWNQERFEAWCAGQTGYPMVDACMRALHQTGWINFRMRAMLISFSSYHLWLHWRKPAVYLARHFLDFEPGIHFSQTQMQAGTTGMNTVRIYSPIKQVTDQDPEGTFIRRYVPELRDVPRKHLAEPHSMPISVQQESGCRIGKNYPAPIVDHKTAYKQARERIYAVKKSAAARDEAKRVYEKHGSRRRPTPSRA